MQQSFIFALLYLFSLNQLHGAAPRKRGSGWSNPSAKRTHRSPPKAPIKDRAPFRTDCSCPNKINASEYPNLFQYYHSAHNAEKSPYGIAIVEEESDTYEHYLIDSKHSNNPKDASCLLVSLLKGFQEMKGPPKGIDKTIKKDMRYVSMYPTLEEKTLELRKLIYKHYTIPKDASEQLKASLEKFQASNEGLTPMILLPFLSKLFNINIITFGTLASSRDEDLKSATFLELESRHLFLPSSGKYNSSLDKILLLITDSRSPTITPTESIPKHVEPLIPTNRVSVRRLSFSKSSAEVLDEPIWEFAPSSSIVNLLD